MVYQYLASSEGRTVGGYRTRIVMVYQTVKLIK